MMIDYSEGFVQHAAAHVVGNGVNGEKLKFSDEPLEIEDDGIQKLLLTYFLSGFTAPEYYAFTSDEGDYSVNPLFKLISGIFSNPHALYKTSIGIASHLYEVTLLPNIKSGDLYVAYLQNIRVGGNLVNAVGIFKSESKDSYLKLNTSTGVFKIKADAGKKEKRYRLG